MAAVASYAAFGGYATSRHFRSDGSGNPMLREAECVVFVVFRFKTFFLFPSVSPSDRIGLVHAALRRMLTPLDTPPPSTI